MALHLLVIGDLLIESTMEIDRFPGPGESAVGERYLFLPAGPAGDAAVAAVCFGVRATLCARVGKDGNGARLRDFFTAGGIGTGHVHTESSSPTGYAVTWKESGGGSDVRRVLCRGAAAKLCEGDVDGALAGEPDAVFLARGLDPYLVGHAVRSCHAAERPVFLDASDPACLDAFSGQNASLWGLYLDDATVARYAGMPVRDASDALKLCLTIGQRLSVSYYIIRLKHRGLFVYDGRRYNIIIGTDASETKTKTGAAEIESAVLCAELLTHRGQNEACQNAAGIAAIAGRLAREAGPRIPTREAVVSYIRDHGLSLKT